MSHTTLTDILPESWIEPLKQLGRKDWLQLEMHPVERSLITAVNWEQCGPIKNHDELLAIVKYTLQNERYEALEILAYSKMLAGGAKIIQPSSEQCSELNLVDINLSIEEYQQPFPIVLVEFPVSFRNAMTNEYGVLCPKFALLMHDGSVPYIMMLTKDRVTEDCVTLLCGNHHGKSIEALLQDFGGNVDERFKQSATLKRVALNLALMLTRYGFTEVGPLDLERFKRNKQLSKAKSKRKRDRARRYLRKSLKLIRFSQDITFSQKLSINDSNYDAIGSPKAPHWRRGHFRLQRVGVGRTESKLTFVKPILINADRFAGNLSDTEYRIRTGTIKTLK